MNTLYIHIINFRLVAILLLALSNIATSYGQDASIKRELLQMFEDQSQDVWVTAYEGLENHTFPFEFVLAHSKEFYHAILQYPNTKVKLYYEGLYNGSFPEDMIERNVLGKATGCMLHLTPHDDFVAGFISINPLSEDEFVFTLMKNANLTQTIYPMASSLLAASYTGQILGEVAEVKLYMGEASIKVKLANGTSANLLELRAEDPLIPTAYIAENISANQFSSSGTDFRILLEPKKLTISYVIDNKKVQEVLIADAEILRNADVYSGAHGRVCISTPVIDSKKFDSWMAVQEATISKDIELIKHNDQSDSYGTQDRFSDHVGIDTKITYFDERFISGNVFIYGYNGSSVKPFIYDKLKDQVLDFHDIIDSKKIPTGIKEWVEHSNNLMLTEGGLAFETKYDPIYGSLKYYVSFAEAVGQYSAMINNRSFLNHFQKQ